MAKLIDRRMPNEINVSDMKDGEIGVITSWPHEGYVGRVVQRYGNNLLTVGKGWENCFRNHFSNNKKDPEAKVSVFTKGEHITLEIE